MSCADMSRRDLDFRVGKGKGVLVPREFYIYNFHTIKFQENGPLTPQPMSLGPPPP